MRRIALSLLALVAIAGLLVTTGCQRENSLRIVAVNPTGELFGDLSDFATWVDPEEEDPEPILIYVVPGDQAELELSYVEFGLGLPTWTPYQAQIEQVTITYRSAGEPDEWEGSYITYDTRIVVPADREGKKTTTATIPVITAEWKENWFGGEAAGYPDELGPVATVIAEIKVKGFDQASGNDVEAEGAITIELGNWWDDIGRIGQ
jgi:hypothetical protein